MIYNIHAQRNELRAMTNISNKESRPTCHNADPAKWHKRDYDYPTANIETNTIPDDEYSYVNAIYWPFYVWPDIWFNSNELSKVNETLTKPKADSNLYRVYV